MLLFVGSHVYVIDNSGAVKAKCICLYKRRAIEPGDVILVTLKKVKPDRKIKRGQVSRAVVVRTRSGSFYCGNHVVSCDSVGVALLKKNGDILGSRFIGPIFHVLSDRSSLKPLSLTSVVY